MRLVSGIFVLFKMPICFFKIAILNLKSLEMQHEMQHEFAVIFQKKQTTHPEKRTIPGGLLVCVEQLL
jgi:hypothetical protein